MQDKVPDEAPFSCQHTGAAAAASPKFIRHGVLNVLPRRQDFLRIASARRCGTDSFLLQARNRNDDATVTRIGFTASKKVGNAVIRARAKRRLRAIARELVPVLGRPGWDYVLVARPGATVTRCYADMLDDLRSAFDSVHQGRRAIPVASIGTRKKG